MTRNGKQKINKPHPLLSYEYLDNSKKLDEAFDLLFEEIAKSKSEQGQKFLNKLSTPVIASMYN